MICLVQCSAKGPAFLAYNRKSAQMTTSWLPIRAGLPVRPDCDSAGALDHCDGFKGLTDIPIHPILVLRITTVSHPIVSAERSEVETPCLIRIDE